MAHRRPRLPEIRATMRAAILADESRAVRERVDAAGLTRADQASIVARAIDLVRTTRTQAGDLHHAGLSRRVRALDARGGGAHVPRRGAAAGPGHGDHRCADRGQDRRVGLGRAPRTLELAAGQRLDVGAAADRQGARRGGGRPGRGAARSDQAPRRAGHPCRGRAGDARAWTPVRARARHARGEGPRGSRAHTGTPRSSAPRCSASTAFPCSPARRAPTCPSSRARAGCWG